MAVTFRRVVNGEVVVQPLQATIPAPTHQPIPQVPTGQQEPEKPPPKAREKSSKFKGTALLGMLLNAETPKSGEDGLLKALHDFAANKFPHRTLTITHKEMPQHSYKVKEFDPLSGRTKLVGDFKGGVLKPIITEREDQLYLATWA